MSYAVAASLPRAQVDAKRIAATSVAIAVHVAVFMVLLMPASTPQVEEKDTVTEVTIIDPPKLAPPPPPPPPQPQHPQPISHTAPQPAPIPIDTQNVMPSDEPNPMGTPPIPEGDANTFGGDPPQSASQFQTLSVLVGPAPPYPRVAQTRHIEGKVLLRIHADANGRPMEVSVEQSSGSRILDEAAMEFVKKRWSFVPAQRDGQNVDAWGLLPIDFVLQ